MVLRKANTTAELGDQFALLVSGVVDYAIFMLDPAGRIIVAIASPSTNAATTATAHAPVR